MCVSQHFQNVLGITKLESTGLQIAYFGGGYLCFSPIAGEVMRRRGYKFTIIMGLSLYSLGSIVSTPTTLLTISKSFLLTQFTEQLFWPCAKFSTTGSPASVFGGFVVCTFVIACGLATLESE
jgi:FHS family L-fucose permease-like MFS transporter